MCGPAGIGKTRALERLADVADSLGFRVLYGRCVESDGAPAFWPWLQVLRSAVSWKPPESLLRALADGAPALARLIPELSALAPETQISHTEPADARAARFVMFDSVARFLKDLSADVPCVVAIDDLHRADAASAALFQHAAREMGSARVAAIVARSNLPGRRAASDAGGGRSPSRS